MKSQWLRGNVLCVDGRGPPTLSQNITKLIYHIRHFLSQTYTYIYIYSLFEVLPMVIQPPSISLKFPNKDNYSQPWQI